MEHKKKSTLLTEAEHFCEVSALLLSKGYMVYRPLADVDGTDLVIKNLCGELIPCQLKSRVFVSWNQYGNKNIWMLFPGNGERFQRAWYLVPHDKIYEILKNEHGHAPKWNHPKKGGHWHCKQLSKKLEQQLVPYSL